MFAKKNTVAARYIVDGFFVASAISISISSFNLFAIRLGASDFQLSLIMFLPQIFTMLILIPGGLFMDSLQNKKRIVIVTLALIMFGFFLCTLAPFAGLYSIPFFLVSVTLAGGALALYNIAWQSFFPGIVNYATRNYVLTLRTRMTLYMNMLVPLLIGIVLTSLGTINGKIIAHQGFFILSIVLLLFAALNFNRFRRWKALNIMNNPEKQTITPVFPQSSKGIQFSEIKDACKNIIKNKQFILFALTALFFHMTWHFDWTLYFIGQVSYLNMNEFQLGLVPLGGAAIQLITLKFWSRRNERFGVVLPFTFGILGLSLCPAFMIVAVSFNIPYMPYIFVILHTISHIPFATITLNLFQCILQVVDNQYRSFYMSVFACLICLSNAVMPVAGIALYHALGADLNGFRYTFAIIFVLRIVAAGLWLLRWKMQKKILSTDSH